MGGSNQSIITAITLNYSGIYLSPFEYYGMDNWKELESIGSIFEEELRKEYATIKRETEILIQKELDLLYKKIDQELVKASDE
jgi:hypothetical protein